MTKRYKYIPHLVRVRRSPNNYIRWERIKLDGNKKRFLQHFPVGALAAWLCFQCWAVGIPFTVVFLVYEVVEDWRIRDYGYKDVLGFASGFGAIAAGLVGQSIW